MAADDSELIDEQIAYYRARASEYDITSPSPEDDRFVDGSDRIRAALRAFEPRGRVLELAAGTGLWTGILAEYADELVVTDSSPEMLALNRAKVGERGIDYRMADAFAMEPTHDHDVVFFGFFLSHVPGGRFEAFWAVVEGLLAPGGRVFFVDEGAHSLWDEDWIDRDAGIVRRPLTDGRVHRAVKVLWTPADLEQRLGELGWEASVKGETPFYWGTARR
jgi:demethylmenaquinone methyltransferase/2-methoxy-6-polyprenyl-1,4-benzoquinol methylase